MNKYHRNSGSVFAIQYHIVWSPKYRAKILRGAVKYRLNRHIRDKAFELGLWIKALSIQVDHVHLFVSGNPSYKPSHVARMMKGYTSKKLRDEFPHLTRRKCLWSPSYYCGSTGYMSTPTVERYVRSQ